MENIDRAAVFGEGEIQEKEIGRIVLHQKQHRSGHGSSPADRSLGLSRTIDRKSFRPPRLELVVFTQSHESIAAQQENFNISPETSYLASTSKLKNTSHKTMLLNEI
jgi:hypothetical protein